eukprot:2583735-Rhodomonas_salina.1
MVGIVGGARSFGGGAQGSGVLGHGRASLGCGGAEAGAARGRAGAGSATSGGAGEAEGMLPLGQATAAALAAQQQSHAQYLVVDLDALELVGDLERQLRGRVVGGRARRTQARAAPSRLGRRGRWRARWRARSAAPLVGRDASRSPESTWLASDAEPRQCLRGHTALRRLEHFSHPRGGGATAVVGEDVRQGQATREVGRWRGEKEGMGEVREEERARGG